MTGWIGTCCACGKAGTGMSLADKCRGETRPLLICDECAKRKPKPAGLWGRAFAWLLERIK